MSVLVFAESSEGKFKKIALEVTGYGKKVANQMGNFTNSSNHKCNGSFFPS